VVGSPSSSVARSGCGEHAAASSSGGGGGVVGRALAGRLLRHLVVIGLLMRRGERRALVLPLLDGDVLLPALQAAERRVAPVKKKKNPDD
jgi:hypothetical protein